jgi:hypothetical protein
MLSQVHARTRRQHLTFPDESVPLKLKLVYRPRTGPSLDTSKVLFGWQCQQKAANIAIDMDEAAV